MLQETDILALSQSLKETDFLREKRLSAWKKWQELSPSLEGLQLPPKGESFADAREDVLRKHYGSLLRDESAELFRHMALLTKGVVVEIEPDTVSEKPISLRFDHEGSWTATHVIVIVGARSKVIFVEELVSSQKGEGTCSHAVEIFVGDEAQVEYISAELADPGVTLWIQQRSSVGAGGSITWHNATLGGKQIRQDLQSRVTGANGTSGINWLFYGKGSERQQLSVRNIFDGHEGGGEILMKGVAEGKAHASASGLIDIGLYGGGTDTYLTQDVLMLDSSAKVDAIPGLEIKTNDVKASHSATVSRATEEDLFYFAARGIGKEEARGMYVQGFIGDLIGSMPDETVKEHLLQAVAQKYESH